MQVLYGVDGLGKTGRERRFRKELEEAVGFPAGLLGALRGEALRAGHIVTGVGDFCLLSFDGPPRFREDRLSVGQDREGVLVFIMVRIGRVVDGGRHKSRVRRVSHEHGARLGKAGQGVRGAGPRHGDIVPAVRVGHVVEVGCRKGPEGRGSRDVDPAGNGLEPIGRGLGPRLSGRGGLGTIVRRAGRAGRAGRAARAAGCPGLFRRLRRLRCLLRRLCGLCGQGLFPGLALGGVLRPEAVRAVRVDAVAGRDRLRHDGREKERRNLDIRAARPIILPGRRARYGAELRQGLLVLLVQLRLDFGFCIAHGTLRSRDGPRRHGTCGGLGAFRPARRPRGQARGGAQADCQDCA